MKFYICQTCGNLFGTIVDMENVPSCCGKQMTELRCETTDGALEKHVPVCTCETISTKDDKEIVAVHIKVGSEPHPMEKYHSIQWIVLETDCGVYRCDLKCCEDKDEKQPAAEATFYICKNEKPLRAYEYCNIHGLYVAEIKKA